MIKSIDIFIAALCVTTTSAMPACPCTREFKPVCGNDGITYNNMCKLNCAQKYDNQLTLLKRGSCEEEILRGSCICTYDYKPVCGTDGKTYPNECTLECQRSLSPELEYSYAGECEREMIKVAEFPNCACTREFKPVCGSNGETYSNPCMFKCAAQVKGDLHIQYEGACVVKREIKPCTCTREMKPVCGTNGVSYTNKCMLECARNTIEGLQVDSEGLCVIETEVPPVSLPCACTKHMQPVCGSNGVTYSNLCMFNCAEKSTEGLKMDYEGRCVIRTELPPISFPCTCTADYIPVCGSNGITYGNICMLNCAMQTTNDLELKYEGACKVRRQLSTCACTRDYNPVCGSNGRTYSNRCMLNCASFSLDGLALLHEGRCY